ncbi:MAG TPA: hypothetical protein VHC95_01160 [Opitutales bacterium]|nr:hypothetical protein [Opitutales bacterium]
MQTLYQSMVALQLVLAFVIGGLIGVGFGFVQNLATRRYERKQAKGKLKNYTSVIPGSFTRVALLLVVLVLVQMACPYLFNNAQAPWWVSGGVMAGYGYILYQKLQAKRKAG